MSSEIEEQFKLFEFALKFNNKYNQRIIIKDQQDLLIKIIQSKNSELINCLNITYDIYLFNEVCTSGNVDLLKLILKKFNITDDNYFNYGRDGYELLLRTIVNRHLDMLDLLLQHPMCYVCKFLLNYIMLDTHLDKDYKLTILKILLNSKKNLTDPDYFKLIETAKKEKLNELIPEFKKYMNIGLKEQIEMLNNKVNILNDTLYDTLNYVNQLNDIQNDNIQKDKIIDQFHIILNKQYKFIDAVKKSIN